MSLRTYQCPYCYEAFKADHDEGSDVDMSPDCGHHFTLGEARRGRPDAANHFELSTLAEKVSQLEARLTAIEGKHL
jgi:hypothetical protein